MGNDLSTETNQKCKTKKQKSNITQQPVSEDQHRQEGNKRAKSDSLDTEMTNSNTQTSNKNQQNHVTITTDTNMINNNIKPKTRPAPQMELSAASFERETPVYRRDVHTEPVMVTDALSNVRERYHINSKEVGHGHYGVVRKCMDRTTKQWYAIKSIAKSKVGRLDVLKTEIDILKEVNHPNIINLIEVLEDVKYLHLITELCTGGELFDRIIAKSQSDEGHYTERDAAKLVRSILDAIAYCHDVKHIVHRDLKPENFLFLSPEEDAPIKIIDFGLSRHDTHGGFMKEKVGTPYYVAPEVLKREYTRSCDIWSIGVITYILLCGYPPFYGDSDNQIFDSVRIGKFDFPSPEWDTISDLAKDFICQLLQMDPRRRLTAKEAMNHKWITVFAGERPTKRASEVMLGSEQHNTFKQYMSLVKFRKIALGYIASHLTQAEVGFLSDLFEKIDTDGNGIELKELDEALAKGDISIELQEKLRNLRKELSLSGEERLNLKDFLAVMTDKSLLIREDKIRMAFEHFKKATNNALLVTDLVDILGGEDQARDIMGAVDTDGDGCISYEEFRQMMTKSFSDSDSVL